MTLILIWNSLAGQSVTILPMDEMLQKSDFISLNLPLLPETRGLVNDEFLGKLRQALTGQYRPR